VTEPVWIAPEAVAVIHALQLAEHGGQDGVRDRGMLQSALQRPHNKLRYEGADLSALAGAYALGIAKNHPFVDGNKRTAAVVCETFLNRNGQAIKASNDEWYEAVLALAAGQTPEDDFAAWLRAHAAPLDA